MNFENNPHIKTASQVFNLPDSSTKAGKVFYGVMLSGSVLLPIVFAAYPRFIEPAIGITTREFYLAFTAAYLLLFSICAAAAKNATARLRKSLNCVTVNDVVLLAPMAAKSEFPAVVTYGRSFWFWQLVVSYLSGVFFSWIFFLFKLFVA